MKSASSVDHERHLDDLFSHALESLITCDVHPEMLSSFQKITHVFGLKHVSYLAVNMPNRSHRDPLIISTYSQGWIERYRSNHYVRFDPVITTGLASILPVEWSALEMASRRVRQLFGEASEFGIGRFGLTFPIRGRHGEHALFSVTSDGTVAEWDQKKRHHTRDLQTIAHHVHNLVLRIEGVNLPVVKLSPQELACLRCIAMGQTIAETADALGLKASTVRYYLEKSRYKLNAINTTNAVARAISMNLMSLGS